MPAFIRTLTREGLAPVAYSAASLADAVQYEPAHSVYTVTNTYNTCQTLRLDAHLDRLEDSARRSGVPIELDRAALRVALRRMITEAGFGDVRFRITARGDRPDAFILTLEPFHPPAPELVTQGVRCSTLADSARHDAAAKTTDWMHTRQSILAATAPDVYEVFLLDAAGHILEGMSSNFYAVLDGELRTAGEGVLAGIARQIVFDITPQVLPLRCEPVHVDDIPRLAEAFLTSSSRGIIPVVAIDSLLIGSGLPGPYTQILRTLYEQQVAQQLEDL